MSPPTLPRVVRAPAELSATVGVLDVPRGPALPFAQNTSDAPSSPPALPRVVRAPAELSATVGVLGLPLGPALPFATTGGGEPPALTLEEYATLRAHLTMRGEEDQATWKQFGIGSLAMKEGLQATFSARFREDPEARERFVELVRRMVTDLRAQTPTR